jgi:hypothetical protein
MRIAVFIVAALVPALVQAAACSARSPAYTTAFVELYTSEGCNSCPPADRWLSRLAKAYPRERVVPLALHVDYWDYIGWKDPYARREFSQRQRRLSQLQRVALVYTPQVVLQGAEFRSWGSAEFERALERINARPAAAQIDLAIVGRSDRALRVKVDARTLAAQEGTGLYLAAYESGLTSQVTAGENRGRLLAHDYVALEWQGPYGLGAHELDLPLLPKARPGDSGAAAFVQNRHTGEVLQALMLGVCTP